MSEREVAAEIARRIADFKRTHSLPAENSIYETGPQEKAPARDEMTALPDREYADTPQPWPSQAVDNSQPFARLARTVRTDSGHARKRSFDESLDDSSFPESAPAESVSPESAFPESSSPESPPPESSLRETEEPSDPGSAGEPGTAADPRWQRQQGLYTGDFSRLLTSEQRERSDRRIERRMLSGHPLQAAVAARPPSLTIPADMKRRVPPDSMRDYSLRRKSSRGAAVMKLAVLAALLAGSTWVVLRQMETGGGSGQPAILAALGSALDRAIGDRIEQATPAPTTDAVPTPAVAPAIAPPPPVPAPDAAPDTAAATQPPATDALTPNADKPGAVQIAAPAEPAPTSAPFAAVTPLLKPAPNAGQTKSADKSEAAPQPPAPIASATVAPAPVHKPASQPFIPTPRPFVSDAGGGAAAAKPFTPKPKPFIPTAKPFVPQAKPFVPSP